MYHCCREIHLISRHNIKAKCTSRAQSHGSCLKSMGNHYARFHTLVLADPVSNSGDDFFIVGSLV